MNLTDLVQQAAEIETIVAPPPLLEFVELEFTPDMTFEADDLVAFGLKMRKVFRTPVDGRDETQMMQERFAVATSVLSRFFKNTGIGQDICDHFIRLSGAFYGLALGTKNPIFEPYSPGNRAQDRADKWHARVFAVVGMECLIKSGMDRETAAEKAAKRAPDLARTLQRNASLKPSLLSWLDQLRHKKIKSDIAQDAYALGMQRLENVVARSSLKNIEEFGYDLIELGGHQARELWQ